jgi:glucose/arabinose dehydrogenase
VLIETNAALQLMDAGPTAREMGHVIEAGELTVPEGFEVEIVANRLSFPSAVAVDEEGRLYVAEAGLAFGRAEADGRIVRIGEDGEATEIATGLDAPILGIAVRNGDLVVAHRGTLSRIGIESGERADLVTDLPWGDHYTHHVVVGPDDRIYFAQGSVTNTGVVGLDNYVMGWLQEHPDRRDVPCRELTLSGENFTTGNPLTDDPADLAITGAFSPFGTETEAGQVVDGQQPCSGAILSVTPEGALEVYADGFRNPYGLAFHPDGRLFVTEWGPDRRGSRPIQGPDNLWAVEEGGWYGFPDFFGGVPTFDLEGQDQQLRLLEDRPSVVEEEPVAQFDPSSAPSGFDFSTDEQFAPVGTAFVALLGDVLNALVTGELDDEPAGQRVVRMTETGQEMEDFLTSADSPEGRPFLRPIDVRFAMDGQALYVTHAGDVRLDEGTIRAFPETGALIRIRRTNGAEATE